MIDAKIEGLAELRAALAKLPAELQGKPMQAAARKAAGVIAKDAKARASTVDDPRTAESIAKNIRVKADGRHLKRTGDVKMRVGVLGGAKQTKDNGHGLAGGKGKENPGGDTWYWRLVEFGTTRTAARPFLRPAAESKAAAALEAFIAAAKQAVEKAAAKVAAKGGA